MHTSARSAECGREQRGRGGGEITMQGANEPRKCKSSNEETDSKRNRGRAIVKEGTRPHHSGKGASRGPLLCIAKRVAVENR
jgi:hypothetical protein